MGDVMLRCNGGRDVMPWPEEDIGAEHVDVSRPSARAVIESGAPYLRVKKLPHEREDRLRFPNWVTRLYLYAPLNLEGPVLALAWRDPELRAALLSVIDLAKPTGGEHEALEALLRSEVPQLFVDEDPSAALGA